MLLPDDLEGVEGDVLAGAEEPLLLVGGLIRGLLCCLLGVLTAGELWVGVCCLVGVLTLDGDCWGRVCLGLL